MEYDVFISYSREDLSVVEPLVKDIEQKAGVKCWIDWNGIETGTQFEEVIIKAIDSVDIVIFFISENSISSQYARMEVNYAYNTKKKVVPIVLDGGTLRGWFLFKFGSIDYIDINQQRQYDKLIQNLQSWCGTAPTLKHEYKFNEKLEIITETERISSKPTEIEGANDEKDRQNKTASTFAPKSVSNSSKSNYRLSRKHIFYIVSILVLLGFLICWHLIYKDNPEMSAVKEIDSIDLFEPIDEITKGEQSLKENIKQEQIRLEKTSEESINIQEKVEPKQSTEIKTNEAERLVQMVKDGKGRDGIYQVGDYYNVNGKEGVVFEVSDNGRHGKIVSLTQKILPWCNSVQDKKNIEVKAISKTDGKVNTDIIFARSDYNNYDAFVWCRNMGRDWYLPAIEELNILLCNTEVQDMVNETLKNKGATPVSLNRESVPDIVFYWSSTEYNKYEARDIVQYLSITHGHTYKLQVGAVRAIARF